VPADLQCSPDPVARGPDSKWSFLKERETTKLMGLAIGLLLIVLLMALAVLAFLITGIVFVVVGAKQKKKGGKGTLGKVGIGLEQFIVCTEEFSRTIIANEGLWQRLNLLFMYMPLGIVAVKSIVGPLEV